MSIISDKNKIVLGISGGVDSTTAALLLLEKGYEVYGLYFNIHENGEAGKHAAQNALVEAYLASGIKLPNDEIVNRYFIYRDVYELFNKIVVSDFCNEYLSGRTPNPCIICNREVKFRMLKEAADEIGAYYIATGHYADVIHDAENKVAYIKASMSKKDQSYMLYRLPQEIVQRIVFPLAAFEEKSTIREIASNMGMSNANQSDSQEICFIENDVPHGNFINEWAKNYKRTVCEGDFVDKSGKILGKHKGIVNYTIGQRKGLGIALGKPAFVTEINAADNEVVLGDNEELFKCHAIIDKLFFSETNSDIVPDGLETKVLSAKVRYAAPRTAVSIRMYQAAEYSENAYKSENINKNSSMLEVIFEVKQRAMTPGQSLVLYDGDIVVGGGRIINTF